MPSDMTNTKRHAFIAEHGEPTAIVGCPTCTEPMALDLAHALYAVDAGTLPDNSSLRWAEASHTDPSADGGKRVALECNRCNRERGGLAQALVPAAVARTLTLVAVEALVN